MTLKACANCGLEIQYEPKLSTPARPVYTHIPAKRWVTYEVGCPAQPRRRATPRQKQLPNLDMAIAHFADRGERLVQPMPPSRRKPNNKRRQTRFDVRGR